MNHPTHTAAHAKRHSLFRAAACVLALAATTTLVTGCANLDTQGDMYSMAETHRADTVARATVEHVRPVTIDASTRTSSLIGELGGGLLGAVAGSAIGHGHGSLLAGVAGGLAGGFAGHELEGHANRIAGLEITVRMPDGRFQTVTQPASEGNFYHGQPVQLQTAPDGTTRVAS
ncbi:glycine zipper 2TM domain-containing protein [Cupriavidus sp. 30B13]|uniref:glycine zipper 2TM domain-containing protein n=1 Tax=Cupriavidus sp. 30B13 TaxID=3384241 RepID=UPI003B8F0B5A